MIRGNQIIQSIFPSEIEENRPEDNRKGIYAVERNECLLTRFYFYYYIKKRRFDTTLSDLAKEFYISTRTITNYIADNGEMLKKLVAQDCSIKDLRKKYPHLIWN
ncbi:hypothetical protein ABIB40_000028 [Pedobacter sp. UYP30]|uniref:HTH domain-containing protein n=1 Tax=Pedobacter sp. UYP30 TaxID=1756400 RepID=UPI0033913840